MSRTLVFLHFKVQSILTSESRLNPCGLILQQMPVEIGIVERGSMTPSVILLYFVICLIQFWEKRIENKQNIGGLLLATEDTFYRGIEFTEFKISTTLSIVYYFPRTFCLELF